MVWIDLKPVATLPERDRKSTEHREGIAAGKAAASIYILPVAIL